jgi:tight adherence protein C
MHAMPWTQLVITQLELAQSLIDMGTLVPFAIFGLFAAGAWLLLEFTVARQPRTEQRLAEIRDPNLRRRDEARKRTDAVSKVLEKAGPALAKPLRPRTEAEAGKLKIKLANAGFRGEMAPSIFLGLKFVGLLGGLFFFGGGMLIFEGFAQKTLITCVAGAGFLFYVPDMAIWFIRRSRQQQIFLGLPDALDLMVVCVEAGLALDQAMRKVSEEMFKTYPVLANEFGLANLQLQMGRPRAEVLRDLATRTGVEDLRSLAGILIQADKFGSSVAQALRVQSDSMRTRRRQIAEEKAAKTAVKLIFPLVIFIFPGIFVVLVGPAAIQYVRNMAPTMSGT